MKNIFKLKSLFGVLITLIFIFSLVSCSKLSKKGPEQSEDALQVKTIEGDDYIAIAAPLTGPYKELGNTIVEGASLAVEEHNEKHNNKIGTIIIDDGGLVSEGLARADLVIAEQALGVIGHLNSEISVETSNKYSKNKIAIISPASTNPVLTEREKLKGYVFRTIGTDRQLAKAAYKYIVGNPQIKKVAVLFNDRVYGKSVAQEFAKKVSKDQPFQIVISEPIPVRTSNHAATATKIANLKPDLVFFVGEYNDAGYLLKDIKKSLPAVQFLGAEGVHHQEFINIAGSSAENALVIGSEPPAEDLAKRYEARFKKPISGYVSTSYQATKVLIDAIDKTHFNKNPQVIAGVIARNKIFNPNGDLMNPDFVIYQVKQARFVPIKTLEIGTAAKAK